MSIDERLKDSAPRLRDAVDAFAPAATVRPEPRRTGWRIAAVVGVAAAILVAVVVIAARDDSSSSRKPVTTPTAPQQYGVDATVLQRTGQPAQLCVGGVFTSLPPQCSGATVLGLDWATAPGVQTLNGVTWSRFHVVGTYDDAKYTFTLTQAPTAPTPPPRLPAEKYGTPCATPSGGWKNPDPSKMTLPNYQAIVGAVRAQPDYAGMWVDNSTPVDGRLEGITNQVLTIAFTGNVDEHRAEIASTWGGAVCVVHHPRSKAQLDTIVQTVAGSLASDLGLRVVGITGVDDITNTIGPIDVLLAKPAAQRALDQRFGAGVVRLHQMLIPVNQH